MRLERVVLLPLAVVVRLTDYEVSGSSSVGKTRADTALAAILS